MASLYNIEDKDSIVEFAKQFVGKSIQSEFANRLGELRLKDKDKGQLGKVIEELYFNYKPNSNAKADFEKAGLELKSSGLKQLRNNEYRAKERLVLSIINYYKAVDENFELDFLNGKNGHLLLIFYLYSKGLNQLSSIIKLVGDWKYPPSDLAIIKQDWLKIQQKIKAGKAHELSEGDTFYLGACTKGADASSVRKQPFSNINAKQRAYSLKQGYVNHIIASIASDRNEIYGKLITSQEELREKTFEDYVVDKFKPYYGSSVEDISILTPKKLNIQTKNFYSTIAKIILNVQLDKEIEEFEKANVVVKAIRVEENGNIIQSVSFPAFEFKKIYDEDWISSEMKDQIEKKFLFIFFKKKGSSYYLKKAKFWNMPLSDRNEVRRIWLKTKEIIQTGKIFKDYDRDKDGNIRLSAKGNPIKLNNFPKMAESPICHIRPHGSDSTETYELPVIEKTLNVTEYSKQCFWLKNTYIRNEIYLTD
ncbi:DNA mismatch repair MutH/Type II restriction enzyme Sau3AI domain-containing protein [Flavobacterium longum]|uniref:Sau3AI family type II restriction endonuclease n=1 Tax=Flavobacterium longum TaxID=1299340 RepID=UPI0039EB2115